MKAAHRSQFDSLSRTTRHHGPVRAVAALLLASAACGAGATDRCDGPRPWKSPDTVEYPMAELRRFYDLGPGLTDAFKQGRLEDARRMAQSYLALAPGFRCDWNYGNAVHNANAALGLIALRDGDRPAAVRYLIAAGKTRGSPQLDSFGPSLMLAQQLAEAGEYDAVATYVRDIGRFWTAQDVSLWCLLGLCDGLSATWLDQLARRRAPDFGMNALKGP